MTTKEYVLKILTENKDKPFSGEILAQQCGVSRAAVWKAVKTLREEGYSIEGLSNGGYLLKGDEEVFNEEKFSSQLCSAFPELEESSIYFFEEIDSTNTYAKQLLAKAGALRGIDGNLTHAGKELNNAVIIAESQTAGRGRFGRTFYSPSKTGIYISLIYVPEGGIKNPAGITAFSAVAVSRAIEKVYGVKSQIKWINDVYIEGKKVCGILTEGIANFETGQIEACVIGIGINIEENEILPSDVKKIAGSILGGNKKNADRCGLSVQVCGEVFKVLNEDFSSVLNEYKSKMFLIGRTVQVYPVIGEEKSSYPAKVVDVDDNAGLIVQLEDETLKSLNSGEVSLKLK